MVVDPALEGRAARIARWDFDADEVADHVRRNRDGGSLQFELPWPTQPQHSDLRLFVRFITFDGRRLEANLPIEVQLGDFGFLDHGWRKSTHRNRHQNAGSGRCHDIRRNRRRRRIGAAFTRPTTTDDEPAVAEMRRAKRRDAGWSPNR